MADPADAGPVGAEPAEAEPRRRRWRRALAETAIMILVAVLLVGLVRAFAFQIFWIPSSSMVPTLGVYDRIVVQKVFFTWRDVREGDIVVFRHPPLDHCGGPQVGRPGQARHRAARADDLLVGQQHLREWAAARRALPAARRPSRAASTGRQQPAPLPGAARRVLHAGRQPGGLMRQPVLGTGQGLEYRRQGGAGVVARRPPRLPPVPDPGRSGWGRKGQPLCLIGDLGTGKTDLLIVLGTAAAMAVRPLHPGLPARQQRPSRPTSRSAAGPRPSPTPPLRRHRRPAHLQRHHHRNRPLSRLRTGQQMS